eukprot:SAG31_NODE_4952_length_2837_cov_3.879474_2_plen_101_part_00
MTGVYRPVLLPDGDGGDDTDALDELDSLMQDLDDMVTPSPARASPTKAQYDPEEEKELRELVASMDEAMLAQTCIDENIGASPHGTCFWWFSLTTRTRWF